MSEAQNAPRPIGFDLKAKVFNDMVSIFKAERKKRARQLLDHADPQLAGEHWMFTDEPFISELCLMLLVGLNHEVERELLNYAALADRDGRQRDDQEDRKNVEQRLVWKELTGREMDDKEYRNNVEQLCKGHRLDWTEIRRRLKLEDRIGNECMVVLRDIANSYKHNPLMEPGEKLLKALQLQPGPPQYASLPESDDLRKALARFIDLREGADFCAIAEGFVEIVGTFLRDVQEHVMLRPRKRDPGSFDPREMSR